MCIRDRLWAAEEGHATAVQALVEAGANVHATRRDGATALALAVQSMDATDDAKDDAAEKKLDSIKRIFEKLRPGIVSTPASCPLLLLLLLRSSGRKLNFSL